MNSYVFENIGALVLRLGAGGMMIPHGIAKFQTILAGDASKWLDPLGIGPAASLWLSMSAEMGCSLLIIAGLFTRAASAALAFNMFVAAFVFMAGQPWAGRELAALFLVAYSAIFFIGAGRYSVSNWILKPMPKIGWLCKY